MPIRFPTMHIAESVTNRILNVRDELEAADAAQAAAPTIPNVPDVVTTEGMQLDSKLSAPPPADMEAPAGVVAPSPGSVAAGEPPIDGIP